MKKEIYFIHSAGPQGPHEGSDDLLHYLRHSLQPSFKLHNPAMPNPENPRYYDWKMRLQADLPIGSSKIALVGHSLGGSVLIKYLSEGLCQAPIVALFLVSVPFWGTRGWIMKEFTPDPDFLERLPKIERTFIYHSRQDPWVPYSHAAFYSKHLPQATVRTLDGAQHEFKTGLPELVKDIHEIEDWL